MSKEDALFTAADKTVERWLADRHQLIVAFKALSDLRPFGHAFLVKPELENFLTLLVDYISSGQFEVFEIISKADAKKNASAEKLDPRLMERLLRTTMFALDFNDKYTGATSFPQLEQDLSALGEQFAIRLECEETLIHLYNDATNWLSKREADPSIKF